MHYTNGGWGGLSHKAQLWTFPGQVHSEVEPGIVGTCPGYADPQDKVPGRIDSDIASRCYAQPSGAQLLRFPPPGGKPVLEAGACYADTRTWKSDVFDHIS
jgi:hypothetical protein